MQRAIHLEADVGCGDCHVKGKQLIVSGLLQGVADACGV